MKKILLAALAVMFVTGASAQYKKTTWSVKAGLNVTNIWNADINPYGILGDVPDVSASADSKFKVGLYAGGAVEFRLGKVFALQPELIYSQQGNRYKFKYEGVEHHWKGKMHYLNLPIMMKFYVGKIMSIDIGPQIGWMMSYKGEGLNWVHDLGSSYEPDFEDFDFSGAVGVSFIALNQFDITVRYTHSITKTAEVGDETWRNGVFQAGLAYRF